MKIRKILVTGAGGFLGGRLVERLLLGEKVPVRAMAHRPAGTVRLVRLPVEIVWGDLTDPTSVERAIAGCDVVIHCAYGASGDRKTVHKVTVDGTRLLAEAALAQGIRHFVHVSTVAVYSFSPPSRVTESTPMVRSGEAYCDDKIEAEEIIWRFIRRENLPATILRMGRIYGPFSGPWTIRPLGHIRDRYVTLVDEGCHPSNAVFVDNAVEAILRAICQETAVGEAFFVTDNEMSWKDWYGCYAAWLGGAPLISLSSTEIDSMRSWKYKIRRLVQDARMVAASPETKKAIMQAIESPYLGALMEKAWNYVPSSARASIKSYLLKRQPTLNLPSVVSSQRPALLPSLGLLQIYASRPVFSNEKAKHVLGYGPLVDADTALHITEQWARWARLTE